MATDLLPTAHERYGNRWAGAILAAGDSSLRSVADSVRSTGGPTHRLPWSRKRPVVEHGGRTVATLTARQGGSSVNWCRAK